MKNQEYKLCVDCGAAFELERNDGGCPCLKRRNSKSKKRYDRRHNGCPICHGMLIDTTDALEQERAMKLKHELPRLEQAHKNENVAGILSRSLR